jgi:ABC-type phosphate transport system auxiliary subunit
VWLRRPLSGSLLGRMVIAVLVGVPLVMLVTIVAWLAVQGWAFHYRPAAVLERLSEKIRPGMRLEEVRVVLAGAGRTIRDSELPRTHDRDVPLGSPGRLKDVVSGGNSYKWEAEGGA